MGRGAGGVGGGRKLDGGDGSTAVGPPMRSITALGVSNDESPFLYVATFRPSGHVAALWIYHDTGATPQGPFGSPTPVASGTRTSPASPPGSTVLDLLSSPPAP